MSSSFTSRGHDARELATNASLISRPRLQARWDGRVPPLLRPALRAWLLGYGFSVGPRVLSLLLHHLVKALRGGSTQRRRNEDNSNSATTAPATSQRPQTPFLGALAKTLKAGTELNRFPAFCAFLVGGSTLLEPVLQKAFAHVLANLSETTRTRLSRWFSSAMAAWFSIQLLQTPQQRSHVGTHGTTTSRSDEPVLPSKAADSANPLAGRTLDLTLFAAVRALDVIIGELWSQRRSHCAPTSGRSTAGARLDRLTSNLADPLIFSLTSGIVMWNWFYSPQSLPRTYNTWIASAAAVDPRLITALQGARNKTILYGQDTGQAALLQSMCAEYSWPLSWGDPAVSVPFPCEVVHMGCGPSCEWHALSRFRRAWLWSIRTYLPLQLFMFLLRLPTTAKQRQIRRNLLRTLVSASRSSAFLGAFITLFYYGVCLARTHIGPRLLGTDTAARQRIDGGLCVGAGCFLCGWSVLLETAGRRKELALFVAPRALATMLPRRYDARKFWMERGVFAISTAVVLTCVLENKRRVRGVLGNVLRMVVAA